MSRLASGLLLAFAIATPVLAAPPAPSSGAGSGKVSLQDMHFSTKADASAHCDKAPVVAAPDGSFTCAAPESSSMAINEKGLPGTKTKPASKPQ